MSNPTEPSTKYFKVSHKIYEEEIFKGLSVRAKALYPVLCKLRNRIGNNEGFYSMSLKRLHKLSGLNRNTIIKARKELIATGILYCEIIPKHITKYKILK